SALGFADIVRYHISEAVQALRETDGPFDLIFNDIDKHGYPASLPVIAEKLRPGGVLIIDNMLWHGRIFDPNDQSPDTEGVREFTRRLTTDPDWIASLVPIRDGLIVAYKK
ncbi:MAG: O-methyltransferase, partial [Chloroflexota bacterium]|nr:O-methyltransferase [Chloroflexota bacterium]